MADDHEVILAHYIQADDEANRLTQGGSRIEFARTQELLRRFLPPPPGYILDIGGGPGAYALWLSESGYRVHLVDVTPLHFEQAQELSRRHGGAFTAEIGDARRLLAAEASFDAVLLLGPLYHLVDRADRIRALQEARRVARPGGLIVAAAISRLASILEAPR
jgi:ubiquinone/menaquinone biosynthesis C-methylase UbiE